MPPSSRFEPSAIKNKIKREDVAAKNKKAKNQQKLQKRLAQAKLEASDPVAKKVRYHLHFYTIHKPIEMVIMLETSGGECPPHTGQYSRI
jgi:hypothetical protein